MKDNFVMGLIFGIILVFAYNIYEDSKNPVIPIPTQASVSQVVPVPSTASVVPIYPVIEPTWTPFYQSMPTATPTGVSLNEALGNPISENPFHGDVKIEEP